MYCCCRWCYFFICVNIFYWIPQIHWLQQVHLVVSLYSRFGIEEMTVKKVEIRNRGDGEDNGTVSLWLVLLQHFWPWLLAQDAFWVLETPQIDHCSPILLWGGVSAISRFPVWARNGGAFSQYTMEILISSGKWAELKESWVMNFANISDMGGHSLPHSPSLLMLVSLMIQVKKRVSSMVSYCEPCRSAYRKFEKDTA